MEIKNKNITLKIDKSTKFKPKIESVEEFKNSIFKNLYDEAKKIIEDILKNSEKIGKSKKEVLDFFDQENENYNNVIAFSGERGTGKTSLMLSFGNLLVKNGINQTIFEPIMIDPSLFESNENIIEIIISKMFSKYRSMIEGKRLEDNYDSKKSLLDKFQKVYRNIKTIEKNEKFIERDEVIEQISNLASSVSLKSNLEKLVDEYLDFVLKKRNKVKILLLLIDDFDLNIHHVNEMSEYIRKYLKLPNIIILTSLNFSELNSLIENDYVKVFDRAINYDLIDKSTLKDKTSKYLEKLIPYPRRLNLPDIKNDRKQIKLDLEYNQEIEILKEHILFLTENTLVNYCLSTPTSHKIMENPKPYREKVINSKEEFIKDIFEAIKNHSFLESSENQKEIFYEKLKSLINEFFLRVYDKHTLDNLNNNISNNNPISETIQTPDRLNKFFLEYLNNKINTDIETKLIDLIKLKTALNFYSGDNNYNTLVPETLRELASLIFLLYELESIDDNNKERLLLKNLDIFRNYFSDIWEKKYLTQSNRNIINIFKNIGTLDKNGYITKFLLQKDIYTNEENSDLISNSCLITILNLLNRLPKNDQMLALGFSIRLNYTFDFNYLLFNKRYNNIYNLIGEYTESIDKLSIKSQKYKLVPNKFIKRIMFFYDFNDLKSIENFEIFKEEFEKKLDEYFNKYSYEYIIVILKDIYEFIKGDTNPLIRGILEFIESFIEVENDNSDLEPLRNIIESFPSSYQEKLRNYLINLSTLINIKEFRFLNSFQNSIKEHEINNIISIIDKYKEKLYVSNPLIAFENITNLIVKYKFITKVKKIRSINTLISDKYILIELLEWIYVFFEFLTKKELIYLDSGSSNSLFSQFFNELNKSNRLFYNYDDVYFFTWNILGLEFYTYDIKETENYKKSILKVAPNENIDWDKNENSMKIKLQNWRKNGFNAGIPIYDVTALENIILNQVGLKSYMQENSGNFSRFIQGFYSILKSNIEDLGNKFYLDSFIYNPIIAPFFDSKEKNQYFRAIFEFVFDEK